MLAPGILAALGAVGCLAAGSSPWSSGPIVPALSFAATRCPSWYRPFLLARLHPSGSAIRTNVEHSPQRWDRFGARRPVNREGTVLVERWIGGGVTHGAALGRHPVMVVRVEGATL